MRFIVCGFIIVVSSTCLAQNTLLQVSVSHQQGTTRAFSGIDDFNVKRMKTNVRLPLLAYGSYVGNWFAGFQFDENRFVLSGSVNDTRRFYRFSLPFEFQLRRDKNWQHILRYEPAYYSDESIIDQTRYVNEFTWLVNYYVNKKVNWVAGIQQDTRFGVDRMYPVFGLESRPNSRIHHHWVFPDIYSSFMLKKEQTMKVFAQPNGGNWRYLQSDGSVASFGMSDWNVGAAWIKNLRYPLQLKIEGGLQMMGDGSVAGADGSLEDGYFVLFSIQTQVLQ